MMVPFPTTTPSIEEVFGNNVEGYRKLCGLSKFQLAADAQIDYKILQAIEHGKHNPTLQTIDRIANALCVPPELLLRTDPTPKIFDLSELQETFNGMPSYWQTKLISVILAFMRINPDI